jgi:hypothetical protein
MPTPFLVGRQQRRMHRPPYSATLQWRGTPCGGLRCMAVGDRVRRLAARHTAPWRVRGAHPWAGLWEVMSPCIHRR